MPKISEAFPSKYLTGASLNGRVVTATVNAVIEEDVGQPPTAKLVCYFRGIERGLVLNKTNAGTLAGLFGDDTDSWRGKLIDLYETETSYQGRQVAAIRVRAAKARPAAVKPAAKPEPALVSDVADDLNDSVEDIGSTI
jgi:hypothetical protein